MTRISFIRTFLTAAILLNSAGLAQAQWDYKTDVKRQISIYAINCSGCDLSGKDYSRTKMKNTILSGAILNRVNFSGATIYNTDLSGAHLKKAFLVRVKGEKVVFRGANLNNSTLTEIELKDSDFRNATLGGAEIRKAKISDTDFSGANLGRVTALASSITGSNFSFAKLNGANLTGSDFSNSIFIGTHFGNANLTAATIVGARLSGAKMAEVEGLKQSQLDTACGDGKTELPVDLTISYCEYAAESSDAHDQQSHAKMAVRDQEIALRAERAIIQTEALMKNASPEARIVLHRIHADLLAIQRKVEE